MKVENKCQLLCKSEIPENGIEFISNRIKENYRMNWLIDGLSAAQKIEGKEGLSLGFPLGYVEKDAVYLNNHYDIEVHYHTQTNKDGLFVKHQLRYNQTSITKKREGPRGPIYL
ncbi:Transmembrane 9 superfamily protein [Smittium mucronatum]|uniref:Transmembrane 9 superfamily member n=1 Tax=Smittium mucronatum TaxID=133383 RepID=A0A1R0GQF1_9FUNG|nr:Transmembrane 9 superfamily protein [Smittium mucronatum]OLY85646.1 Transmembrane 9 superfamily protein [Smittium mucronatum]